MSPVEISPILRNYAKYYFKINDFQQAKIFINKSINLRINNSNNNHPKLCAMYEIYSSIYEAENNILDAFHQIKEAIRINVFNFSDGHPDMEKYKNTLQRLKDKL